MANFAASVFIGTSLDGFIARENGDLDWLTSSAAALGDTGYDAFFDSIDTLVVGRTTYETILGFGQWPYEGKRVLILSRTLAHESEAAAAAGSAGPQLEALTSVHGSLDDAVATLTSEGARRVYVDGGQTIQSFLRAGLITDLTITRAPVLLGSGAPLFGPLDHDVALELTGTRELGAGFTQSTYEVVKESAA